MFRVSFLVTHMAVCCACSPYVVKLFDVFETKRHYLIVLERVRGGELFDYIVDRGHLPRREALRVISQVVQGL